MPSPEIIKTAAGASIQTGIWSLVVIAVVTLLGYIIKQVVPWRIAAQAGENEDMNRLGRRITELEARIDAADKRADSATEKAHTVEMRMVSVVSAFQLVAAELRRHDPTSPALMQAQELISTAMTGDFGMSQAINRLAVFKGVGE